MLVTTETLPGRGDKSYCRRNITFNVVVKLVKKTFQMLTSVCNSAKHLLKHLSLT